MGAAHERKTPATHKTLALTSDRVSGEEYFPRCNKRLMIAVSISLLFSSYTERDGVQDFERKQRTCVTIISPSFSAYRPLLVDFSSIASLLWHSHRTSVSVLCSVHFAVRPRSILRVPPILPRCCLRMSSHDQSTVHSYVVVVPARHSSLHSSFRLAGHLMRCMHLSYERNSLAFDGE